jgi:hypothetical protein
MDEVFKRATAQNIARPDRGLNVVGDDELDRENRSNWTFGG